MPISNKALHLEQSQIFLQGGETGTKAPVISCNVTTGSGGDEIYFHHQDCSDVLYAGLLMNFVARRRCEVESLRWDPLYPNDLFPHHVSFVYLFIKE